MARIGEGAFRQYVDGQDRLTAREYMSERELIRLAVNDLDDKVERTESIREEFSNTVNEVEVFKEEVTLTKQTVENIESSVGTISKTVNRVGDKETISSLNEGQFGIAKDTKEVFVGVDQTSVRRILDELDKAEILAQTADILTLKPGSQGNDYAQIMAALDSTATTIRFTKGQYTILRPITIAQKSNKKLVFEEGAKLHWRHGGRVSANNTGYEAMFRIRGSKDISILGGFFSTDGVEFDMGNGIKSQWMHFFYCDDAYSTMCENIVVDGAKGRDFPGDFFEIYGGRNVYIRNCKFDRCWRTGVSPVKCENLWIEKNEFTNCSLESTNEFPGGINFEADLHEHFMLNVFVRDNIFKSNTKGMSFTPKSDRWGNIHITGNHFEGRYWMRLGHTFSIKQDYNDVFIDNNNFIATSTNALYQYPNTRIENMKFNNCRFEQIGASSMVWFTSQADVTFEGCQFINSGGTVFPPEGIIRTDYTNEYRNLKFKRCKFVHNSTTTGMSKIFGLQANLMLDDCDLSGLPSAPIFAQFDDVNKSLQIKDITWNAVTVNVIGSSSSNPRDLNLKVSNSDTKLSFSDAYVNLKGYLINAPELYLPIPSKYNMLEFDYNSSKRQNVVVSKSTSQTIPNSTPTAVAFDLEDFDTNSLHDNVTNNSRLICRQAGVYTISANINFATNSTGARSIEIKLNGNKTLCSQQANASVVGYTNLGVSTIYKLNPGDFVEVFASQSSNEPLAITVGNRNSFSMAKV